MEQEEGEDTDPEVRQDFEEFDGEDTLAPDREESREPDDGFLRDNLLDLDDDFHQNFRQITEIQALAHTHTRFYVYVYIYLTSIYYSTHQDRVRASKWRKISFFHVWRQLKRYG